MQSFIPVIIATVNSILIAFILRKRNKSLSDFLLIMLNLLTIVLGIVNSYSSDQITTFIFFLQSFIPFLLFPVLFLSIYSFLHDGHFKWKWLFLFSLAISFLIFFIVDHGVLKRYDADALVQLYNDPPISYHIFYKSNQIFSLVMCLILLGEISQYEKKIKNEFSYIEQIEARWLKHSVYAFLGISAAVLVAFLLSNFSIIPMSIDSVYQVLGIITLVAIIYVNVGGIQSYSAHQYKEILARQNDQSDTDEVKPEIETIPEDEVRRRNNSSGNEQLVTIYHQIIDQLEGEKLYLTPQLKLHDLCAQVGETFHRCSKAINEVGQTSFYDLVNSYRIAHFKKQLSLPENDHLTILAIGLESGFNSKASLNRTFKSKEGMSPLAFKKSLNQGSQPV